MLALASAVPLMIRVLSLVVPSLAVPVSAVMAVTAGAAGVPVSMVTLNAAEEADVLPALSVAVAVIA